MSPIDSSKGLRKPQISFVFRFQLRRVGSPIGCRQSKQFLDARQGAAGRECSSLDGFVRAPEIVPSQRLYIRAQHQIRMPLPKLNLVFLRRADRSRDHLEHVRGSATVAILHAYRNANHYWCADGACGLRRNRRYQAAVRQAACADFHWLEESGKGAACTDRIHQIALRENHGIARRQIRRDNRDRNPQILELSRFKYPLNQASQTLVAGQSQPRNPPPGDVAKSQTSAARYDSIQRSAARISRAKNASYA